MSALIPYAASELSSPAAQLGLAVGQQLGSAALAAGKKMYANRANAGRTKKRKVESRKLADLGRPAGHDESKKNDRQSPPTSIANKELEFEPLIRVEKDVAASENITKRQRDTLHHKGVKVCFMCKNTRKQALFLNWAIVLPKAANTIGSLDLLRGDDQERDHPIDQNSTTMDLRCLPINTDRYIVLKHKRKTILPDSDKGTTSTEGRDLVVIEDYIKTNRQVFFDGDNAEPLQNMFMVWWVDYYGAPVGVKTASCEVSWKIINYFKEV